MAPIAPDQVTPDTVLRLQAPTKEFLCPLKANVYGVEFQQFEIKDYDSGNVLFQVRRVPGTPSISSLEGLDAATEATLRTIRYTFPASFLRLNTIRTSLVFSVGPKEVPKFRMVERHYFKDRLIRSYDFTFGFCIPSSTNSWEAIYPMPKLSEAEVAEMVACPWEAKSDSFYFVENTLIMHNKAEFTYQ